MSLKHQIARKEIIEAGLEIQQAAFVVGTWGNISVRIEEDELIAITPSGIEYNKLVNENIAIVDMEGNLIDGNLKPSTELTLHLSLYKARPDVQAIVHTHPVHCTAMATARKPIPAAFEDLVQIIGGRVHVSEYRLPGAEDLSTVIRHAMGERNAVLIANHGLMTMGRTLKEAIQAAYVCENAARATLLAANVGGAVEFSPTDIRILRNFYLTQYGQR